MAHPRGQPEKRVMQRQADQREAWSSREEMGPRISFVVNQLQGPKLGLCSHTCVQVPHFPLLAGDLGQIRFCL